MRLFGPKNSFSGCNFAIQQNFKNRNIQKMVMVDSLLKMQTAKKNFHQWREKLGCGKKNSRPSDLAVFYPIDVQLALNGSFIQGPFNVLCVNLNYWIKKFPGTGKDGNSRWRGNFLTDFFATQLKTRQIQFYNKHWSMQHVRVWLRVAKVKKPQKSRFFGHISGLRPGCRRVEGNYLPWYLYLSNATSFNSLGLVATKCRRYSRSLYICALISNILLSKQYEKSFGFFISFSSSKIN